jgi:hydrogenase expression/formation protein HypE
VLRTFDMGDWIWLSRTLGEEKAVNSQNKSFNIACPAPTADTGYIKLGHGSGGRMTEQLIEQAFLPALSNKILAEKEDASVVPLTADRLAFTTDSYVVSPIIFPGGDIGSLSVHGTVNDLCMRGAKPLYLSAAFIMEEGLCRARLETVVNSMRDACIESGIQLVTADTKVVNKGCADELFITTSGIGIIERQFVPSVSSAEEGDVVICSGDIGRHGMAIMAARAGLDLENTIESDSAPLNIMVDRLAEIGVSLHVLRDVTRGGLAGVLNEIAQASQVGIEIEELQIGVVDQVRAACEILGLDPLYVACEGRLVAIVKAVDEAIALEILRNSPHGQNAKTIGRVVAEHPERVVMRSRVGGRRIVDKLSGEQLPRIC